MSFNIFAYHVFTWSPFKCLNLKNGFVWVFFRELLFLTVLCFLGGGAVKSSAW